MSYVWKLWNIISLTVFMDSKSTMTFYHAKINLCMCSKNFNSYFSVALRLMNACVCACSLKMWPDFCKTFQIAHQAKIKLTLLSDSYTTILLVYTLNITGSTQGLVLTDVFSECCDRLEWWYLALWKTRPHESKWVHRLIKFTKYLCVWILLYISH